MVKGVLDSTSTSSDFYTVFDNIVATNPQLSKTITEVRNESNLFLVKVLRFYAHRDMAFVKELGTGKEYYCHLTHEMLSYEVSLNCMCDGDVQTGDKYGTYVVPYSNIYGIVANVRFKGTTDEKCLLACLNYDDNNQLKSNVRNGEIKLVSGDSTLSLTRERINLMTPQLFINGLPYNEPKLENYYDKSQINTTLSLLKEDTNVKLAELNNAVANIEDVGKKIISPKTIVENEDLNDYTEVGMYYCPYNTVATTLTNCPVTNAFSLFVEKPSGYENACTQTLTSYDGTRIKKFSRFIQTVDGTFQNSGWQPIYEDTGWKDVSFPSGFTHHSDTDRVRYRRVGKVVELRGAVKNINQLSLSNTDTTFTLATISDTSCRPSQRIICRQQGSQMNTFLLAINTNGAISLSRYGTTSVTNVGASSWLNVSTTFLVD